MTWNAEKVSTEGQLSFTVKRTLVDANGWLIDSPMGTLRALPGACFATKHRNSFEEFGRDAACPGVAVCEKEERSTGGQIRHITSIY